MWIQWLKCMNGFIWIAGQTCTTKNIEVVDRPFTLKAIRRKNDLIWRKTRITINFNIYYDSSMAMRKAISKRKTELMDQRVINYEGDQKKLFSLIHSLLGVKNHSVSRIYQLFYFGIFNQHFLLTKFIWSKWKRVYQRIRLLI